MHMPAMTSNVEFNDDSIGIGQVPLYDNRPKTKKLKPIKREKSL